MSVYRFIGQEAEVHLGDKHIKLERLGQAITLTDEEARSLALQHLQILPEAEYTKAGVTAEEEKRFAFSASHEAPEFKAKKLGLQQAWQAWYDSLSRPQLVQPAAAAIEVIDNG